MDLLYNLFFHPEIDSVAPFAVYRFDSIFIHDGVSEQPSSRPATLLRYFSIETQHYLQCLSLTVHPRRHLDIQKRV